MYVHSYSFQWYKWYQAQNRSRKSAIVRIVEDGCCSSYLSRGHKVERPKRTPHVWDVGLKIVERGRDVLLDLVGLLPRRAIGRDLVHGRRHGGGR